MMRLILAGLILFFISNSGDAQEKNNFEDQVFVDYLGDVSLTVRGTYFGIPIVQLGRTGLTLTFDELDGTERDYLYKIIHCTSDWKQTDEDPINYIDGYEQYEIQNLEYSFNTRQEFIQYNLSLPNSNTKFLWSGNYVLQIYTDDTDNELVLTRRFCVAESTPIQAAIKKRAAADASKIRTHQEIGFSIDHKNFQDSNPARFFKCVLIQNYRWSSAVYIKKPSRILSESVEYDQPGKYLFPGLREFRGLDIRNFSFRQPEWQTLDYYSDGFGIVLKPERPGIHHIYRDDIDINGQYVVMRNTDRLIPELSNRESAFQVLKCDYASVTFQLDKSLEVFGKDVYIMGAFNSWRLTPKNKMTYLQEINTYEVTLDLKQGFYNYLYATVDPDTKAVDYVDLEGSHFESTNDYTLLVYYRSFADRYDRLVAYTTANSR